MQNKFGFILVNPQLGENIGSCARALKNFGFSNLNIVMPRDPWPNTKARMTSVGAYNIIQKAKVYKNVSEAVKKFDLVFTCGVLIHINPNRLNLTYSKIFNLSKKYILIAEYFNPVPAKVTYRNNKNKLFKRDFAKEIMNKYNLKLIDYGFLWKEDKRYTADNITWFLFKK